MKQFFVWIIVSFLSLCSFAQVQVDATAEFTSIAEQSEYILDTSKTLTIQDVWQQTNWTKTHSSHPYFDFSTDAYWFKFTITNPDEAQSFYLETARPLTNIATLYSFNERNEIVTQQNGDEYPIATREINHRKILFPIYLKKGQTKTYYLFVQSDGEVLTVPLKLWNIKAFEHNDYVEQFILGGYYGILILAFVLYSFFYVALKEKSFLYYVLYIFGMFLLMFSLDGFTYQLFFPNNPYLGNHSVIFTAAIAVIAVMKYAQTYLNLAVILPKLNKTFNGVMLLTALVALLGLFDGKLYEISFPLTNLVSLISTLLILLAVILAIRKNCKVSMLFFFAFIFLIAGALIFILSNFDVIPPSMFTDHAMKLGSGLEILFLSLTMANKFSEIQQEKEKAQAVALDQLEEMNKLKDEANEKLELQVKERTKEINHQKEELQEKNEEIIDSINYAKGIQDSILPTGEDFKKFLPNSFVLFMPKDIVSGDFYFLSPTKDGVIASVADCTGHGVPGCLVSLVGANGLNRCIKEYNITQPALMLDKLTLLVEETFSARKDGMDMSLVKLLTNSNTPTIEWAGAHNPLYIIRKGICDENSLKTSIPEKVKHNIFDKHTLFELVPNKQPIGAFSSRTTFVNHTVELQKEDVIYMFSDGYPDQFGGPKGKKFMSKRLKKLLVDINEKAMQDQHKILHKTVVDWMNEGNTEQIDDICFMGIKV